MVYRGLPWYTMVYDGMPTLVHHFTTWFTMVNHGISYHHTMVYHGRTMVYHGIPCLHYGIAEELIHLKYTITFSEWVAVLSGVPQGSVLGPLLFLIFLNDLPDWVVNGISMFADDTIIWRGIYTVEDKESLQDDLDKLMSWSEEWLLKFNPEKCKLMRIGHGLQTEYEMTENGISHKLQVSHEEKDLGIYRVGQIK